MDLHARPPDKAGTSSGLRVSANTRMHTYICTYIHARWYTDVGIGWLRLVGSLKLSVSFAEYIVSFIRLFCQKRSMILRSLVIVATPYVIPRKVSASWVCAHSLRCSTHCNTLHNTLQYGVATITRRMSTHSDSAREWAHTQLRQWAHTQIYVYTCTDICTRVCAYVHVYVHM